MIPPMYPVETYSSFKVGFVLLSSIKSNTKPYFSDDHFVIHGMASWDREYINLFFAASKIFHFSIFFALLKSEIVRLNSIIAQTSW